VVFRRLDGVAVDDAVDELLAVLTFDVGGLLVRLCSEGWMDMIE